MTKASRPPCPRCENPRMWKLHKRPELKCPNCGYRTKVVSSYIALWRNSNLADMRRRLGGGYGSR